MSRTHLSCSVLGLLGSNISQQSDFRLNLFNFDVAGHVADEELVRKFVIVVESVRSEDQFLQALRYIKGWNLLRGSVEVEQAFFEKMYELFLDCEYKSFWKQITRDAPEKWGIHNEAKRKKQGVFKF